MARAQGEGSLFHVKTGRNAGKWCGILDLGTGPDGKRRRRYVYGPTKKAVAAKLDELKADAQKGTLVDTKRLTVAEYLDKWYKHCAARGLEPKTLDRYEEIIRLHLDPTLGRLQLTKVSPLHLQELYASKLADGKSAQTVKHIHRAAHTAFEQAVHWQLIPRNPAKAVQPPRVPRKKQPALNLEQTLRYFEALQGERLRTLYIMAALTATRQSELFGLRWSNVDLENGTATIEEKVHYMGGRPRWGNTKTMESRRTIPLLRELVQELRQHRDRQMFERKAAKDAWQDHDLVFCRPDGTPLRHYDVYKAHHTALQKAGCPDIQYKNLRHTTAVLLIALGAPLKVVSEILGHSTIKLTADVYGSDVSMDIQRQVMNRLGEALFGTGK